MAKKKIGEMIKDARTNAGLSQEKLSSMVDGLSASDISKAERGEKELTQAQLKAIAKATGVTQKSLIEAAGSMAMAKAGTMEKKEGSTSGKVVKLTSAEEKLVELYRKADSDTKKAAIALLKGEKTQAGEMLSSLLDSPAVKDVVYSLFKETK